MLAQKTQLTPVWIINKSAKTKIYLFSIFALILLVVLFIFTINYLSAFSGGNGTSKRPYEISTCTDLQNIENNLTANYVLVNNIDCSATKTWNGGKGFSPIGNAFNVFTGSLDGKGYVISNLYMKNDSADSYLGLFAIIGAASGTTTTTVKNVRLNNVNITYNGTSTGTYQGTIAGALNTRGKITNSYATGNVIAYRYVGGLVGFNYGTISNSYSFVKITASQHHVGGLVGLLESTGVINNSYALGNVSGVLAVGGLLGSISAGTIRNSFSAGNVTGTDGYVGGLVGYQNLAGTITNSFWDTQTSGQSTSAGGTGKATKQMKNVSVFENAGWNLNSIWIYGANSSSLSWDIDTATYNIKSFSISSRESATTSLSFKPTGNRMYVIGNNSDTVIQYTLSTPWDVSTSFYDNKNFSVATQDGSPHSIFFNSSGNRMYILGISNNRVFQYTLSTPWDVSTASYSPKVNFSVGTQDADPQGIFFNSAGNKMYMVGAVGDRIFQYTLSTPWDVSTASYSPKVNFSVATQDGSPTAIFFNSSGNKMYMIGEVNNMVYQYTLSTPWVVSTAKYDKKNFSVAGQEVQVKDVFFNTSGNNMYVIGWNTDTVYQYSLRLSDYPFLRVEEFSGGSGISSDPFQISTCLQLQSMNNGTSLNYILNKIIDCSATTTWNKRTGFIPIGNYTSGKQFSGSLNGSGYFVNNLFINRSSPDQGLIGFLSGTITDIGVENVNITKKSSEINNNAGGLVGKLIGTINNSYSTGNVSGNGTVGGLVGISVGGNINNSYSSVKVLSSSIFSGGLVGAMTSSATIYKSYSYGKVTTAGGGLVGATGTFIVSNSFWDTQTSGQSTSAGGTGKTTTQMKTASTYTNWDFIDNWRLDSSVNKGYPYLTRFKIYFTKPTTTSGTFSRNSINATVVARAANPDRIYIRLYNSSGLVSSATTTDNYLTTTFTNLAGGTYYLNATVNDSSNNLFSTNTRTITFDTIKPRITINKPTGTQTSLDIPFNVTLSDNLGLGTCKYWVTRGESTEISNTTVSCTGTSTIITGSFSITLNAVYSFHFHVTDISGNGNQTNSSFTVSTGIGGGGAGVTPIKVEQVIVYANKTFCGDLICQGNGNDYGVKEDFYSCSMDCEPFDLDALIFSFTKNCFDKDPSTICIFATLFGIEQNIQDIEMENRVFIKDKQVCKGDVCEPLGGKTLTYNCFVGKPCFFATSTGAITLLIIFFGFVVISLIKIDSGQGKKVSPYSWVKIKIRKRRR